MKRISIFLMASLFVLCAVAQGADKTGMISLKPYIPEDAGLSPKLHKQLMTKMSQIASAKVLTIALSLRQISKKQSWPKPLPSP